MQQPCSFCNTMNDADARFCIGCGRLLDEGGGIPARPKRRVYFLVFLFLPVIAAAGALGYYRFFLPDGVAAIVNGEEITRSELDAAESRLRGRGIRSADAFRYVVLNQLIAERLILQAARKAGTRVSAEEVAAEAGRPATHGSAGQGAPASLFTGGVITPEREQDPGQRLLMNTFLAQTVVPPGADGVAAQKAAEQWLRAAVGRASIRIDLSEEGVTTGCGCSGSPPSR